MARYRVRTQKPSVVTAATPFPDGLRITGHFDGAIVGRSKARLEKGQMGVGYVLEQPTAGRLPLAYAGGLIGAGTSNEAEYYAAILMCRHALRLGLWSIEVYTDSLLVRQQTEGQWKVTKGRLKRLNSELRQLRGLFSNFSITHIPREENSEADYLSHTVQYREPALPPLPRKKGQGLVLHSFQAAAIRSWWLRGKTTNVGLLQRVFGLTSNRTVEGIVKGETYRDADFSLPLLLPPDGVVSSEEPAGPQLNIGMTEV